MTTALLWFRRDLRLADHPALTRAARDFDRVVLRLRARRRAAPRALLPRPRGRRSCSAACARSTPACASAAAGSSSARAGRSASSSRWRGEVGAEAVLWTSDVAPYARARDGRVTEALRGAGRAGAPADRRLRRRHRQPRTQGGKPFTVFTPFFKHWRTLERRTVHRAPAQLAPLPSVLRKGRLPARARRPRARRAALRAGRGGRARALGRLARRPDRRLRRAPTTRSARHGTSGLSPYLRWGCVSAAECEARAARHGGAGARGLDPPAVLARLLRPRPARPSRQRAPGVPGEVPRPGVGGRRRRVRRLARGPHRLSARRRRHAPARAHGLDAQPRAARRRVVSHEGPAPRLAPGRAPLRGAAARRRAGAEQRQLAVGDLGRRRSRAVLPAHVQPRPAAAEVRSRRRLRAPLGARAARRARRAPRGAVDG